MFGFGGNLAATTSSCTHGTSYILKQLSSRAPFTSQYEQHGGLTIRCHIHKLLSHSKWPVQCDSFPEQWEKQHHSYFFHFHIFNHKNLTLIKACRATKGGDVMLTLHVLSQRMNPSHFLSLPRRTLRLSVHLTGWNWLGSFLSVCEVASGCKCAWLLAPIKIWGNSI